MTKLQWLNGYTGQTTDELLSLEGEFRTDSLVLAFEQAINQKAEQIGKEKLTEEERVVLAVEALEREVNNDGYLSFFISPTKVFVPIIIDALKRIDCAETAMITQRAIDLLEIEGPMPMTIDNVLLQEENEELEDKLYECDKEYYKVAGDLSIPLLNYIKNNKHKIVLDGRVLRLNNKPWWKFW